MGKGQIASEANMNEARNKVKVSYKDTNYNYDNSVHTDVKGNGNAVGANAQSQYTGGDGGSGTGSSSQNMNGNQHVGGDAAQAPAHHAAATHHTAAAAAAKPAPAQPAEPAAQTAVAAGGHNFSWLTDPHFLTIAGIVAGTTGLVALIRSFSHGIKGRFQKCAKQLFRMQKAFMQPDGMDMKSIMNVNTASSIVSRFLSPENWARHLFGSSRAVKGVNIGVYPFIRMYEDEIEQHYEEAVNAFTATRRANTDENDLPKDADLLPGTNNEVADKGHAENSGLNIPFKNAIEESADGRRTYGSFAEAFASKGKDGKMNEAILSTALGIVTAGSALYGMLQKIKVKKDPSTGNNIYVANGKSVQVNKQSTREIALAIIANFLNTYTNTEALCRAAGINVNSLDAIDKGNIDKFKNAVMKLGDEKAKLGTKDAGKLYGRMNTMWNSMISRYDGVGKMFISNFKKYTKVPPDNRRFRKENVENQMAAAEMKLSTAWEQHIDYLKNKIGDVVTAVVSSDPYREYLNFILQKVFPVFEQGLASISDESIDVYPHKNDYFIVRQTATQANFTGGEGDGKEGNPGEPHVGNIMFVRLDTDVTGRKTPMKFTLIARYAGDTKSITDQDTSEFDIDKMTGQGQWESLGDAQRNVNDYIHWLSLDPVQLTRYQVSDIQNSVTEKNSLPANIVLKGRERKANVNGKNVTVTDYMYCKFVPAEGSGNSNQSGNSVQGKATLYCATSTDTEYKFGVRRIENPSVKMDGTFEQIRDGINSKYVGFNKATDDVRTQNMIIDRFKHETGTPDVVKTIDEIEFLKNGAPVGNANAIGADDVAAKMHNFLTGDEQIKKILDAVSEAKNVLTAHIQQTNAANTNANAAQNADNGGKSSAATESAGSNALSAGKIDEDGEQTQQGQDAQQSQQQDQGKQQNQNQNQKQEPQQNQNQNQKQEPQQNQNQAAQQQANIQNSVWKDSETIRLAYQANSIKLPNGISAGFELSAPVEKQGTTANILFKYTISDGDKVKAVTKGAVAGTIDLKTKDMLKIDAQSLRAAIDDKANVSEFVSGFDDDTLAKINAEQNGGNGETESLAAAGGNALSEAVRSSIRLSYSHSVSESYGTAAVTRKLASPMFKNKERIYAISEAAFNDGMHADLEGYLGRLEGKVRSLGTYDAISSFAKNSKSVSMNCVVNESCTYTVQLPSNGAVPFALGNDLYESVVLVAFDKTIRNVKFVINGGIHKITD